jgi:hypothetical protein
MTTEEQLPHERGVAPCVASLSRTGQYDPQALKRVWHYVARFGA